MSYNCYNYIQTILLTVNEKFNVLLSYKEGLNGPDYLTVLWDPLDAAHSGLKFR